MRCGFLIWQYGMRVRRKRRIPREKFLVKTVRDDIMDSISANAADEFQIC